MVQLIPRGGLLRNAILFAGLLACTASPAAAQELPHSTAFPGSFWISTGDVGPAEKDNVVTQAAFEQGITVWERSSWFAIPYLSAGFTADSAGYEWNDRHPFQVGMKLVRRVPGVPFRRAAA